MELETRYHMLRPDQIVARRQACPVVYIPIGTLEWHGLHNPVGADTLQAEGLAILCAQKGGGLVFPPLYYGESRVEALVEATARDRDLVAERMGLSPGNFFPDRQPFTPAEQVLNYHKLLLHILAEAESLGFKVGVLVAGHFFPFGQQSHQVFHLHLSGRGESLRLQPPVRFGAHARVLKHVGRPCERVCATAAQRDHPAVSHPLHQRQVAGGQVDPIERLSNCDAHF